MGFLGRQNRKNERYSPADDVSATTFLTVVMFAFWLNCSDFLDLLFFAICVPYSVGVAKVVSAVLVADMIRPEHLLPAWSFVNSPDAPFLLVCEVIAQFMVDDTDRVIPYFHAQMFAGLCSYTYTSVARIQGAACATRKSRDVALQLREKLLQRYSA
ncbi:hypothetical protein HG536_0H04980 [Torulaspora globosa]|uniref:Uncharacterized protein n=1 Tax=Torulaspora globosa TaxID=48254 RepID=A0A7G3ZNN5_9SACH|nr:uncharacterized protein HG536_0H04980 [Torulaspora globosa]QLL35121.1 hypothetical protein HG536_0H04980 [Torulaspora globosa]